MIARSHLLSLMLAPDMQHLSVTDATPSSKFSNDADAVITEYFEDNWSKKNGLHLQVFRMSKNRSLESNRMM